MKTELSFNNCVLKHFAVEFVLEQVFQLSWKTGAKDAKLHVNYIVQQYKNSPADQQCLSTISDHLRKEVVNNEYKCCEKLYI